MARFNPEGPEMIKRHHMCLLAISCAQGRMGITKVEEFYVTAAYYDDHGNNVLNRISGSNNASGSFVVVGSQSLSYDSAAVWPHGGFLNSVSAGRANYVDFTGKCFWN